MIRFRALGTVELARDGEPLRQLLAQPKSLALLAYLAFARPGPFHRRDTLLGLFWPEADNGGARASLRAALHRLRRSLGEDAVLRRGNEEVGLDGEALWSDVTAFEGAVENDCLRDAAELYRGDLLPGFFLSDAPAFDQWLEARRLELRKTAARATWALVERLESEGDPREAVRWAQIAAGHAPFDEGGQRRLIALLDRTGNRAGALRAYDQLAERLRCELEVEPSPETEELVRGIRERSEVSGAAVGAVDESVQPPVRTGIVEGSRRRSRSPAPSSGRPRYATAALAVVGIAALTVATLSSGSAPPSEDAIAQPTIPDMAGPGFHDRRVIVVPFENRTGDPSLDVIGRFAADWTAQGLMETGMVEVVSPAEVLRSYQVLESDGGEPAVAELAMTLAEQTRSRILVSGAYHLSGDRLVFHGQVTDAADGVLLRSIERVTGRRAAPEAFLRALRGRIVGSLATVIDPRLSSWSTGASQPHNVEAYRLYAEGVDQFLRGQPGSGETLRQAWSLDTTFTAPLIWGFYAPGWSNDSILAYLSRHKAALPPWDRAMADHVLAHAERDWDSAVAAAYRVLEYAPDSEWAYKLAYAANHAGRPTEAIEALTRIDPDAGWLREWPSYWSALAAAHHLRGDYRNQLLAVRLGRQRFGDDRYTFEEIRSLVGLGEVQEAMRVAARSRDRWVPTVATPHWSSDPILEFRAHGYSEEADTVALWALQWYEESIDTTQTDPYTRYGHAVLLARAGQVERAAERIDGVAEAFASQNRWPMHAKILGEAGVLEARRGNLDHAARIVEELTGWPLPDVIPYRRNAIIFQRFRAASQVAVSQGDLDTAAEFLLRALEHGLPHTIVHYEFYELQAHPRIQRLLQYGSSPVSTNMR